MGQTYSLVYFELFFKLRQVFVNVVDIHSPQSMHAYEYGTICHTAISSVGTSPAGKRLPGCISFGFKNQTSTYHQLYIRIR
jgi:hypothetical protein